MIKQANTLDELGFYKEADLIDRILIAQNNFKLKKKPKNLNTKIDELKRSVDYLQTLVTGVGNSMDFSDDGETSVKVEVANQPVEFTLK
jgi:hypothetical protein